ncbi:MAG: potassium transporter TrkG [Crocinitomicaceae bacterium]|jgi:trk system potassium uptake protein TrkH|nr:potassium transporter TrkG [Crocinitomicaceae bacterium]
MNIREFREKVNLTIYNSKTKVLATLNILYVLVSLFSIGVLVYYYGFPLTDQESVFAFKLLQYSFAFYIIRFLVKIVYQFDVPEFLRSNWFEASALGLLIIEGVYYNITGSFLIEPIFTGMGFTRFADFSMIFVQLFIFILMMTNLVKQRNFKPWAKAHPGWLFTFSIAFMTIIGAGFLMLPEMSVNGVGFIDALFTSMSSVSVTGLTTFDISQELTLKGQVVVMILMKLGGLNTIAFGALMLVVAKFGVGIKYHSMIEDFVNKDSILKANSMLAKIVLWATAIEVIGIILLYLGFGDKGIFADESVRIFHSVFHGISGFNNAGLSSLQGGMMHPDVLHNTYVHTVVMILFFLGGFGMIYVFDLFEIKRLRERMKTPWKTIGFGTKISLYFTLGLLLFGAIIFFIFEYNNTLTHKSFYSDFISSLFMSMTTRNAGFNVVDTAALSTPVLIIFLFLMFVGASSGSAGGGIRTSTFAVIWASVSSTIRGKKNTELFKRTIDNEMVLKAYAIMMFFVAGNIIGPFVMSISEADLLATGKYDFMDLVFEHVSAASTVGLSTGMTPELSPVGKIVLVIAMFIGRVGTLTLAYLIGKRVISRNYKYPTGHTMLG